ncbi:MAG: hypothetical protein GF346_08055 [Candidatus Eisenbacteria bacterium]|nr:hypothetical protein [Candidatus Latescibacterota bacterium]MBD3302386.1 hypothetical protein [Candidatus Eisenbacteria bacterium]
MSEERTPFSIALETLNEGMNLRRLEGRADEIDLPEDDGEVLGPIVLEGRFIRSHTNVEVQGRLAVRLRQRCVRCLAELEAVLEPEIRVYCKRRRDREGATAEGDAPEEGLVYYDGRVLDLGGEIRETLLLEIPGHPLCRPHCKGLCPRCGNDRNLGDCACPPQGTAGPWEALRSILEDDRPRQDGERGEG